MKIKKTKKYRCSGCNKLRKNRNGRFIQWNKDKSTRVKVCFDCFKFINKTRGNSKDKTTLTNQDLFNIRYNLRIYGPQTKTIGEKLWD